MDSKYYRHFKGNYYEIITEAKDSETQEDMIVYRALYGDGKTWVRPKSMFFETISRDGYSGPRFMPVSKDEALKCHFPDIPYTKGFLMLCEPGSVFSPQVKGMITLLKNKEIISTDLSECINDDGIERLIIKMIREYRPGDPTQDIFHYIQIWGGMSGRNIYVNGFDWKKIEPHYKLLVNCCLSVYDNTPQEREKLLESVRAFGTNVKNIGLSFITKHTRFWLTRNLGMNALPIFDSIMANNILIASKSQTYSNLRVYWNAMSDMAEKEGVQLISLERQLFKYFFNQ